MTQPNLFADCVLPGCPHPVEDAGQACRSCREAFGDMLAPAQAEAMTAEDIAHRDHAVREAYAARRDTGQAEAAGETAAESRPNQRCWLCEERRTCTRRPGGWECRTCAASAS
jgi:hypothetical protein